MKTLPLHKAKRLPVTITMLLAGVVTAGFVSNIIESPVMTNDYLHEHLSESAAVLDAMWEGNSVRLPIQDRQKIVKIIRDTSRPNWTATADAPITGQALAVAKESTCKTLASVCSFDIRIAQKFRESHVNQDLRVANVSQKSVRVRFRSQPNVSDVKLMEMVDETRLFRFYQTQSGWVQKTSEILEVEPLDVDTRERKLAAKFAEDFVGVNYYPASASWNEFWTEFPEVEIKSDLKLIRKMNANSVRIFINHAYFNHPDTQSDAKSKLQTFLDLCEENSIKALVTLFDLRPDYTLSNMESDLEHIDAVLSGVSDHPSILGIDIKNQADLDFAGWGQGVVEGWLTVMLRHIQLQYRDIPVTVGWSQPRNALGLKDVVDFVTYHEYENPNGFAGRLEAIKAEAIDKPVMITELGSTIWSPFRTTRSAEIKQALRLQNQLEQSFAADGVFVWTLHDFEKVGSDVVGRRPWRKAQQKHFGLVRSDGSDRPAKSVLQSHASKRAHQSKN